MSSPASPLPAPRPAAAPTVKVLYIAGWGRSGTTILDNILGSHDGVFSAGEVHYLWRRGFLQHRKCGCGKPLLDCEVWQAILDAAYGDEVPDAQEVDDLQGRVVRVRRVPALLNAALRHRPDPDLEAYSTILGNLYRGIGAATGARVVVDSSKRPSDAAVVARLAGVEPYLLHVVRDPRAVAFSWARHKIQPDRPSPMELVRHGAAESTVSWVSWNAATEALARVFPKGHYLRIRYEDLVDEPRPVIGRIFSFLGEAELGSPFRDGHTVVLAPNHTASGNPSRFRTGEVVLRRDDVWRRDQRPADRYLSTALAVPLLRHYGYSLQVPAV